MDILEKLDAVQYDFNFQHAITTNDADLLVASLSDHGVLITIAKANELIVNLKKVGASYDNI
tara:strand:- start:1131 stop:1316 length:186 start_codon:yes stop_codon:yes gene_type:complete